VDPGKSGAIAFVDDNLAVLGVHVMPVLPAAATGGKKKGRTEYDLATIVRLFTQYQHGGGKPGRLAVALEKGHPLPPKMGGGIANYERGYARGVFEGILHALGIPHVLVSPKTWQKEAHAGTSGDDLKQKSIVAAGRLFPHVDLRRTERCTVAHDGKAEALLLARFLRNA
jgi:crossover junction endodeoxyribonuclease RuvC